MAEKKSFMPASRDGPRKCTACEITFPDIYAYAEHLESKEHVKGVMKKKYGEKYLEAKANLSKNTSNELDESEKSENSDDEGEVYTCEICKKICAGPLSYRLHLAGKKHEKNVKKAKIRKQLQKDKLIPDDDDSGEDNPPMKATFTKSENLSSDILCKVCNKKYPDPEALKQHTKSEGHKKKLLLKELVPEKNSAEDSESCDEEVINCDICSKEFSGPVPYYQHMKSGAHDKQVKKSNQLKKLKDLVINSEDDDNRIQCKECNKFFSGVKPFQEHMKSSSHSRLKRKNELLKKLQEIYPEMLVTQLVDSDDSDEESYAILCTVCHVTFTGPESAKDHFQSQKHNKVVKEKKRFKKYQHLKGKKQSNRKLKSYADDNKIFVDEESSDSFDIID